MTVTLFGDLPEARFPKTMTSFRMRFNRVQPCAQIVWSEFGHIDEKVLLRQLLVANWVPDFLLHLQANF